MMKKYRFFLCIIVLIFLVGLSGCGMIRNLIEKDPIGSMLVATLSGTSVHTTDTPFEFTPQPGTNIESGTILFTDDFSDPTSGWEETEDDTGHVYYDNGGYIVEAYQANYLYWGVAGQYFSDVSIDVDASVLQTNEKENDGFGIVCRVQSNGDGYSFRISSDGYVSIVVFVNEEADALVDWKESDAVLTDGSINHITAICQKNRLTLKVNGTIAAEVVDDTFTEGDIAMAAVTYEDQLISVKFDDLVVRQLGVPTAEQEQQIHAVEIDNPTSYEVCFVYIDSATGEYWGDNRLKKDETISSMDANTFNLIVDDIVDVRVESCKHLTLYEEYDINLEGNSTITLEEPVVLYQQPFKDLAGWPVGAVDGGKTSHSQGDYYSVISKKADTLIRAASDFEGADVIVHSDASLAKEGGDNMAQYGITCRMQPDGSGIFFAIRGDGSANIIKIEGDERIELLDWYSSRFINAGVSSNYIEGYCFGSDYMMYVNGTYIGSVEDVEYTSGKVGVAVYPTTGETTQVDFDFVDVYASY